MKTTSEMARIAKQLQLAFDGEAWHGPALLELLADVNARMAAARPVAGAHTIWELTLHVQAWEEVIRRRLGGEALTLTEEEDFPKITDSSDSAWKQAIQGLRAQHEKLLATISGMAEERLGEKVPGKEYDIYTMLHGATQHAIYHAGQIAILKKALGQ